MMRYLDLPPIWFAGSYVVIWLINRVLPGWASYPSIGWLLTLTGLAVIGWAAIWFFLRKTPIEPRHVPKTLLVEGPYRLSRNPIYLGLVVIALGVAIGRGHPLGLIAVAGLAVILHRRFVMPEENGLRQAFGAEADAYIAKTRRWI